MIHVKVNDRVRWWRPKSGEVHDGVVIRVHFVNAVEVYDIGWNGVTERAVPLSRILSVVHDKNPIAS